jgi:hypothetical protein
MNGISDWHIEISDWGTGGGTTGASEPVVHGTVHAHSRSLSACGTLVMSMLTLCVPLCVRGACFGVV